MMTKSLSRLFLALVAATPPALACACACAGGSAGDATESGESSSGDPPHFPAIGPLRGPDGAGSFRFGAASAATQIEDQNPNTDWYVWTAPAPAGLGQGTFVGDASQGYARAIDDVALLQAMGLDAYRFSVEWGRIEPARDVIDEAALAHYDAFIDALIAAGIRPMITLHHFSNPIWVDDPRDVSCAAGPTDQNLCGWNHPTGSIEIIAEFAEHAALLGERFGDRVDEWGTVNEPLNYLLASYGIGNFPPGKSGILGDIDGVFIAAVRGYLGGHAAAFDALKAADTIDADGDGDPAAVGFTQAVGAWVPARGNLLSDDPEDLAARDRLVRVYHYLWVDAILEGAFDPDLDGVLDEPHPEWAGRLDWLGVQYYFRAGVTADPGLMPLIAVTPCFGDFDFGACVPPLDPSYRVPAMNYEHYPLGLYEVLVDLGARWPTLPLTVTESGIATQVGRRRAEAVVRAIEAIDRARTEGVDVRGYYHWSIYDNFEWAEGYTPRFGLYTVDFQSYARTATEGATILGEIAAARGISDAIKAEYGGDGPMTPEG